MAWWSKSDTVVFLPFANVEQAHTIALAAKLEFTGNAASDKSLSIKCVILYTRNEWQISEAILRVSPT